jgi:DNA ligase D-like protein (predicted 3'-phosphoesterase)
MSHSLDRYRDKRDFHKTTEPDETDDALDWATKRPIFVIQKHDASTLHYDFRLEVNGVLKSWAVPKGPSTDPAEKRLAIPTEDHPLAYADFEGVIPADNYGAGTVLIWDRGSYRNLKFDRHDEAAASVAAQIDQGHVTVWLEGEKICGGYALIRTDQGKEERWLLIKMDDEAADARRKPTSTQPKSVHSGRSLEEIADAEAS